MFIGGGTISSNTFMINLPYDKWGMYPENMAVIATDILTKICKSFNAAYQFNVTYEIGNKRWIIKPIGEIDLQPLKNDLASLGLPTDGELINSVDLTMAKRKLKDIAVESFLSGIFDTRASLTKSHRRFSDGAPVVSIEVPGSSRNFRFVVQLCSWLTEHGTVTDQILYNHPCQHASADPSYKGWKKGFKIRFLVKSFLAKHSFAMQAKAFDVEKLKKNQEKKEQAPCSSRNPKHVSPIAIHSDIGSKTLPKEVRNHLFFHYHHICAVLGCPYAPNNAVMELVSRHRSLISVFPLLAKGETEEMSQKYMAIKKAYFNDSELSTFTLTVGQLLSHDQYRKYSDLEMGLAYLFSKQLKGKRHCGSKDIILDKFLHLDIKMTFAIQVDGSPLLMINPRNNRAVIVSSVECKLNQDALSKIIKIDNLKVMVE